MLASTAVDCGFEHRSDKNIALNAVNCGFEHRSDKNKDYRNGTFCICHFSVTDHLTLSTTISYDDGKQITWAEPSK